MIFTYAPASVSQTLKISNTISIVSNVTHGGKYANYIFLISGDRCFKYGFVPHLVPVLLIDGWLMKK